mgnify:CR=1 FL=1
MRGAQPVRAVREVEGIARGQRNLEPAGQVAKAALGKRAEQLPARLHADVRRLRSEGLEASDPRENLAEQCGDDQGQRHRRSDERRAFAAGSLEGRRVGGHALLVAVRW